MPGWRLALVPLAQPAKRRIFRVQKAPLDVFPQRAANLHCSIAVMKLCKTRLLQTQSICKARDPVELLLVQMSERFMRHIDDVAMRMPATLDLTFGSR